MLVTDIWKIDTANASQTVTRWTEKIEYIAFGIELGFHYSGLLDGFAGLKLIPKKTMYICQFIRPRFSDSHGSRGDCKLDCHVNR